MTKREKELLMAAKALLRHAFPGQPWDEETLADNTPDGTCWGDWMTDGRAVQRLHRAVKALEGSPAKQ